MADASVAPTVVSRLLGDDAGAALKQETAARDQELRHRASDRGESRLLDLAAARANAPVLDWDSNEPPRPRQPGVEVMADLDLDRLRDYIDWTPFFHTWRLSGTYPALLDDPRTGAEARRLLNDANGLLDRLIADGDLRAAAAVGLFAAAGDGDDAVLYTDDDRRNELRRVPFLRQQRRSSAGRPNVSLADYLAPVTSGKQDWLGAFVVTAGLGAADAAARYEQAGDDYTAILIKAVADRLAEAGAEYLHAEVRRRSWGYAPDEDLDLADLIAERYRGIRPAPGYPACPDHHGKRIIFDLLDAERACGVSLSESYAMAPAATVAGWYFCHPQARYFGLGKIDRDQLRDYAARAGLDLDAAARQLAANLL